MKQIKFLVVYLLFSAFFNGASAQTFQWSKRYDSGVVDSCIDVRLTSTGSLVHLAGVTKNGSSQKLVTRCFDPAGVEQWTRIGNTFLPGEILFFKRDFQFNTVLLCKNGTIYTLIRYDVNNIETFRKTLTDRPIGMDIEGSIRIYVGYNAVAGFKAECYLSSNGTTQWTRTDNMGMNAGAFTLDRNNNVYIGGQKRTTSVNPDRRVTKFNVASATYVWAVDHSNGPGEDGIDLMNVDAAGNVYCDGVGNMFSLSDHRYLTKFNVNGVVQWSITSGTIAGFNNVYHPKFIHFDSQQDVFLIGSIYYIAAANPSNIFYVKKVSRINGAGIFEVAPNFTQAVVNEIFYGYTSDAFDNIYLCGKLCITSASNDGYCRITKISGANGTLKWDVLGTGHSNSNTVNSAAVSSMGELYLGNTENNFTVDLVLRKYTQINNGAKLSSDDENTEVYPNPFTSTIYFDHLQGEVNATLFDINGRLIKSELVFDNRFDIDTDLPSGVYFLWISNDGERKVYRMVKQ
ncbi:MAG: T9SS type A sorting domain-containing protein [Bacteroidetes bacterium]|nr:T9SS type A sorting domain-containing protein [Bacteroidota bacterium]